MLAWYDESAARDRLVFAALVALVVHLGVILGVGFAREEPEPAPRSLDITLAQRSEEQPRPDADFLAQTNQQGSGTLAVRQELRSPVVSEMTAVEVREVLRETAAPQPEQAEQSAATVLGTVSAAPNKTAPPAPQAESVPQNTPAPVPEQARSSEEISSLLARLDAQQQAYAKLPKVHRVTSVSTRASVDAAYLINWTRRVETIGNNNYPLEARQRQLYGDLRLLVAVDPDGGVREVRVLQSSGHRLLDEAALRIVRLAAPFDPFPPELRAEADVLEIIRTWQFRSNRLSAGESG